MEVDITKTIYCNIDTNEEFIQYMRQGMLPEQHELFVQNHLLYLKYKDTPEAFVVNIDDVWKLIGFTRRDNAVKVLKKHFINQEDYIEQKLHLFLEEQNINDEKLIDIKIDENALLHRKERNYDDKQNGGQNKINIIMTIDTFKNFCMIASTDKAKQIRKYYVQLENILHSYVNMKITQNTTKLLQDAQTGKENERHELLRKRYDGIRLVYIMKILELPDGSYLIKLGSSLGIDRRTMQIDSQYKIKLKVLEVYPCELFREFESHMHHHPKLINLKYKETINNIKPNEFYRIKNEFDYGLILKTIKNELPKFKYYNRKLQALELRDKMKDKDLIISENNRIISENNRAIIDKLSEKLNKKELLEAIKIMFKNDTKLQSSGNYDNQNESKINPPINREITESPEVKPSVNFESEARSSDSAKNGPRVQVYDKNDITKLLYVFDGIMEATRNIPESNFTQIKKKSASNRIHAGYRWLLIDRTDENYNTPRKLEPTNYDDKTNNNDAIAILDSTKKIIIKIFTQQNEVAEYINVSDATISGAIKFGSIISDKYYCVNLKHISDEMKEEYFKTNTTPLKPRTKSRGKKVHKIDSKTGEILETLDSITDAQKKYVMSAVTLKTYNENGRNYNGFKWRIEE